MNKIFLALWAILMPSALWADTLFTLPDTDKSKDFIVGLFGSADLESSHNVLGAMFGTYNAALLALGGIVIAYTMVMSTINTAHEGEMLGKKWSAVWIPVRTAMGIALLLPKTSGYSLIQVFVLWVVMQGMGAADQVWNTALSALKTGSVGASAQHRPILQNMLKVPLIYWKYNVTNICFKYFGISTLIE